MTSSDGYLAWDPADAIAKQQLESDVLDIGNPSETALAAIRDNAPMAARSIIHLAIYSRDEKVRLRAAQYVVDKATEGRSINDPFAELLEKMSQE